MNFDVKNYLERFEKMVNELRQNENVVLLTYQILPPPKTVLLEKIIQEYPLLNADFKAFYEVCNGIQLRWIHKKNEAYNPSIHSYQDAPLQATYGMQDYQPEDGLVMIIPIELFSYDWIDSVYFDEDFMHENQTEFANKTYNTFEFAKSVKPFDIFSMYRQMNIFTGNMQDFTHYPVLMGDDHQACLTDSRITNFASYLEFILYSKGLVNARGTFYSKYNGSKFPPLQTPASYFENMPCIDLSLYQNTDGVQLPFTKSFWD
ncbi:MAG: hypothetical protein SFU27_02860 [Thermonemataceae bacterium]|nr:hypothetical protein [Thermonemataceae bacterium]